MNLLAISRNEDLRLSISQSGSLMQSHKPAGVLTFFFLFSEPSAPVVEVILQNALCTLVPLLDRSEQDPSSLQSRQPADGALRNVSVTL